MLYQLKEYGFPLDQSFSTPSSPHPVTELQELLQKRHIRSPSYAYVPHDGTHGHMKEYTCICRVEKFNLGKFQNVCLDTNCSQDNRRDTAVSNQRNVTT